MEEESPSPKIPKDVPYDIPDIRVSMSEDTSLSNNILADQALDRLEAAEIQNPLSHAPRESMLTGAIDFGGFRGVS